MLRGCEGRPDRESPDSPPVRTRRQSRLAASPDSPPVRTLSQRNLDAPCFFHAKGVASCMAATDGTALRFNFSPANSRGRPHSIRPTPGWRTQSRWDCISQARWAARGVTTHWRMDHELPIARNRFKMLATIRNVANTGLASGGSAKLDVENQFRLRAHTCPPLTRLPVFKPCLQTSFGHSSGALQIVMI